MHRFILLTALTTAAGCVTADLEESTESQLLDWEETVVTEPVMRVSCEGCTGDRVAGEPVTIYTSYYGECESAPFWPEYACRPQSYALYIECVGGACAQAFAGNDGLTRATQVTPLGAGELTIRVHMDDRVFLLGPMTAHVPDAIRVTCLHGEAFAEPCSAGPNDPPVVLDLELYAGTRRLDVAGTFEVTSTRPGTGFGLHEESWYLDDPGEHAVHVRYGALSTDYTVRVKVPLPPVMERASVLSAGVD